MVRDLNVIAPLISMFFLITYAVVNLVMLIESGLGLVSFRPTLRIPFWVPLLGTAGCLFAMFIVNPTFSLISWGMVTALYIWIMQRRLTRRTDDVRSGLFVALAELAAKKVTELEITTSRAWKPNFLLPVLDGAEVRGEFKLITDLCQPSGSIKLLGIANKETVGDLTPRVASLGQAFRAKNVFATWSIIDSIGYVEGTVTGLQALGSAFFRPNVLMLSANGAAPHNLDLARVTDEGHRLKIGVAIVAMHPKAGLGRTAVVNLWLRPPDPDEAVEQWLIRGNMNLGLLLGYRLRRAWEAELNLISCVQQAADLERVGVMLDELRDLVRIPRMARSHVLIGDFEDVVDKAPQSDIDIMGMPQPSDMEFVTRMVTRTRSSCIFTLDSGRESALA